MMMIVTFYKNTLVGFSERKEGRKKERRENQGNRKLYLRKREYLTWKERKKNKGGKGRRGELTKTLPVTKTIMSSVVSP